MHRITTRQVQLCQFLIQHHLKKGPFCMFLLLYNRFRKMIKTPRLITK